MYIHEKGLLGIVISHHIQQYHHILKTFQECETTCEHMITLITARPDVNMRTRQLLLLRDCADICTFTVKCIARNGFFAKGTAGLCATVCEACGKECSRFPDPESQHCANICLYCARECRAFAMT